MKTVNDALYANNNTFVRAFRFAHIARSLPKKLILSYSFLYQKLNSWLVGTVCGFRPLFSIFLSIFLQQ